MIPCPYPLPKARRTWRWVQVSAASLPTRAWTLISAVNLRTKILGMVLALVLILGSGVTLQVRATLSRTLMAQLQEASVSLGRDLARAAPTRC